jgi:hypothetical protein
VDNHDKLAGVVGVHLRRARGLWRPGNKRDVHGVQRHAWCSETCMVFRDMHGVQRHGGVQLTITIMVHRNSYMKKKVLKSQKQIKLATESQL